MLRQVIFCESFVAEKRDADDVMGTQSEQVYWFNWFEIGFPAISRYNCIVLGGNQPASAKAQGGNAPRAAPG